MSGWEAMLAELVEHRLRDLTAYASMLTGNRADAEDLVQEALIVTFSRGRNFPSRQAAEAYTRRVIASRFIDARRRAKVERRALASVAVVHGDAAPSHADPVGAATDVGGALGLLSPRERACVVLRHLEQMTTAETAQTLGLSPGSVKRYLSDAMVKLRGSLGDITVPDADDLATVEGRSAS